MRMKVHRRIPSGECGITIVFRDMSSLALDSLTHLRLYYVFPTHTTFAYRQYSLPTCLQLVERISQGSPIQTFVPRG